jgi:hypothetical protein
MRVALIGNFEPEFSTENDLKYAMERNDWHVRSVQSGDVGAFCTLIHDVRHSGDVPDFVVWVRTAGLWANYGWDLQWKFLAECRRRHVPVVGYHLDRWWGLKRQHEIDEEPFFHCDLLVTADGGHPDEWKDRAINHVHFLPAVSEKWCRPGQFREELATDIVFVGSWQGGYHREWGHRYELVKWLQDNYRDRVRFYPIQGQHAVRGLELNDVYWSAKVVVGDSCLVPKTDGSPMTDYCSDRIPETLGRGGYLLHPAVDGVNAGRDDPFWHEHCLCDWWTLGDWDELRLRIDTELETGDFGTLRERDRRMDLILKNHTYTYRMGMLLALLRNRGYVS